jgi:hypothetical protein
VSSFRAVALALSLVVELGCTNLVEEDEMALKPWHLWGSTESFDVISPGIGQVRVAATQQLARVRYARPESFRFLFAATINSGQGVGGAPVAPGGNHTVGFDVTSGIGRARVTLKNFAQFNFAWPGAFAIEIGQQKWASKVLMPQLDDQAAVPIPIIDTDTLIAQDIQVETHATLNTVAANDVVQIAVSCSFAPNAHVRPEWYMRQFNGEEHKGQ